MSFWNSRTQMEHAKTRAIDVKKSNGHNEEIEDEDYDEDNLYKHKDENKKLILDIANLNAYIAKQDVEIRRLRELLDGNTQFMQQIIMELINKPAAKTASQIYAETRSNLPVTVPTKSQDIKGKLP